MLALLVVGIRGGFCQQEEFHSFSRGICSSNFTCLEGIFVSLLFEVCITRASSKAAPLLERFRKNNFLREMLADKSACSQIIVILGKDKMAALTP